jgi:hypothetical protein
MVDDPFSSDNTLNPLFLLSSYTIFERWVDV